MPVIKEVSYSSEYKHKFILKLILMVIINVVSAFAIGVLLGYMNPSAVEFCDKLIEDKLAIGYNMIFLESFFCGMIMYFAIKCYSKIGVISLILGIVTFILCGFEHSIANAAYLGISATIDRERLLIIEVSVYGNTVGSLLVSRFDT